MEERIFSCFVVVDYCDNDDDKCGDKYDSRVILILMKFRILILACCQVVLTASLVSEQFLFSL